MNRRNFLRLAGGGLVVAASAATMYGCTGFEVPATAIAAWDRPGAGGDLRLPETDPSGRQILMGCGGFLELLALAADTQRQRAVIELFHEGEPTDVLDSRPIARIRLIPELQAQPDPLFAQILLRRTDRRQYLAHRRSEAAHGAALKSAVAGLPLTCGLAGLDVPDEQVRVGALRDIAQAAWRIELNIKRVMMETMRVLRFGSAEIDAHRDGLNITSPMVVMMKRFGIFDPKTFPGTDSTATVAQVKIFRRHYARHARIPVDHNPGQSARTADRCRSWLSPPQSGGDGSGSGDASELSGNAGIPGNGWAIHGGTSPASGAQSRMHHSDAGADRLSAT